MTSQWKNLCSTHLTYACTFVHSCIAYIHVVLKILTFIPLMDLCLMNICVRTSMNLSMHIFFAAGALISSFSSFFSKPLSPT